MTGPPKKKAAARAGAAASETPNLIKVRPDHTATTGEVPEHRNNRRRFLIYALMAGLVPPERVVERVVAEVDEETHGA
jgi:hypothetical protein